MRNLYIVAMPEDEIFAHEYESFVIAADTPLEARTIAAYFVESADDIEKKKHRRKWETKATVEYIGRHWKAVKGIIHSSWRESSR